MTDSLIRIVAAGGGIDIDASSMMTDSLIRIAAAASKSGATVRLKNVGNLMSDSLTRIGAASKGNVIFVLD